MCIRDRLFEPSVLSLAVVDLLTGVVCTPLVILIYYYSEHALFYFISSILSILSFNCLFYTPEHTREEAGCTDVMKDFLKEHRFRLHE